MNVIDVSGDRRLSGHRPLGRRARVDRVELAKQAGIPGIEQIRLLARRAIENLRQHVGQGALKDRVVGVHRFSCIETDASTDWLLVMASVAMGRESGEPNQIASAYSVIHF